MYLIAKTITDIGDMYTSPEGSDDYNFWYGI